MLELYVYYAFSGVEDKISTCRTIKEMWDKLDVTYEGTTKVNKTRISALVNKYELFEMEKNEGVESMFACFSKIVCELKSLDMIYSNSFQVKKLVRSLLKTWKTKATILENRDLHNTTYERLRDNLFAYEQNHINRYRKDDKKKPISFSAIRSGEDENIDENNNKRMSLINRGVRKILRQRPQRPQ